MEKIVTLLVTSCLKKLESLGRIKPEQVDDVEWYVSFSEAKLRQKKFVGAATLDVNNKPVIYLSRNLSIEGYLNIIAHETVHLMQILKGDLFPGWGFQIWKGRAYESLPADHPEYFEKQPWEKEARELQPVLFKHLSGTSAQQHKDSE